MAPPLQVRQRRRQLAGRPIGGLQLARRLTSTARRSDRLDPTVSPDPGPSVEMRAYGEYGVSWIRPAASPAFVLAQVFAAHGACVAPCVRLGSARC